MRSLLIAFMLLVFYSGHTQITWDTTRELSRHEAGYGKFKPGIKVSVFYNGNMGVEVARVHNKLALAWLLNNTFCKYYGLQWIANTKYKAGLIGPKAGAEFDFRFLRFGLSAIALTDFEQVKYYLTPGVGISWFGTIGVYYDFIVTMSSKDFVGNNKYQLGIKYNFTKHLSKEFRDGTDF